MLIKPITQLTHSPVMDLPFIAMIHIPTPPTPWLLSGLKGAASWRAAKVSVDQCWTPENGWFHGMNMANYQVLDPQKLAKDDDQS